MGRPGKGGVNDLVKRLRLEADMTERIVTLLNRVDVDMAIRITTSLYEFYRRTPRASGSGRPVDLNSARSRAVDWFIANPGRNRYEAAKALGIHSKQCANAAEKAVRDGRLVRIGPGCFAAPGVKAVPHPLGRGPGSVRKKVART